MILDAGLNGRSRFREELPLSLSFKLGEETSGGAFGSRRLLVHLFHAVKLLERRRRRRRREESQDDAISELAVLAV